MNYPLPENLRDNYSSNPTQHPSQERLYHTTPTYPDNDQFLEDINRFRSMANSYLQSMASRQEHHHLNNAPQVQNNRKNHVDEACNFIEGISIVIAFLALAVLLCCRFF